MPSSLHADAKSHPSTNDPIGAEGAPMITRTPRPLRKLIVMVVVTIAAGAVFACSSDEYDTHVKLGCHLLEDGECYCSAFVNGPEPSSNPTCSEAALPGTICCSDTRWPATDEGTSNCVCVRATDSDTCMTVGDGARTRYPIRVKECSLTSTAPSSSGSSGDSSDDDACTDRGFCGPSMDRCNCGLSCIHYAVGGYMCGVSCQQDSDCEGKKDPETGRALSSCPAPLDTPTMTYDSACN